MILRIFIEYIESIYSNHVTLIGTIFPDKVELGVMVLKRYIFLRAPLVDAV